MLLELVATLFAGLGAAGIALLGRLITAKRLPRWSVPASAGFAMLAFQVYSEYTWFGHQKSLLPPSLVVVSSVEEKALWRPWTLLYPQTVRFAAVAVDGTATNASNPELVLANLYLFQRRHAAKRVPLVIHCAKGARAHFNDSLIVPKQGEALNQQWHLLESNDPLLRTVCIDSGLNSGRQE